MQEFKCYRLGNLFTNAVAFDTKSYIREVTNTMGGIGNLPRMMNSLYKLARGMCRVESRYVLDEENFCKAFGLLPEKMQKYWQG